MPIVTECAGVLKQAAKRWVRPLLIPIVRLCIRHAPHEKVRRALWIYLVAPFFQSANHSFVATTLFGAIVSGNTEDVIQRYIFYFGFWEPNLTEFLKTRLIEGDVFVDVGANIGYFTLLASRLVGRAGKVIAIDASPTIFAKLLGNLKRNQATNVNALNVAVSDHTGTARVFLAPHSNIGETSIIANEGLRYECDVFADSLDSLLAPEDVAKVRLVKIDVEGAEWLVIAGMRDFLRRGRPDLEVVIEMQPQSIREHGKTVEEVFAVFSELGFFPYQIENDYSALSYMSRKDFKRPVRIRSRISTQTDVVFSRKNADCL